MGLGLVSKLGWKGTSVEGLGQSGGRTGSSTNTLPFSNFSDFPFGSSSVLELRGEWLVML